MCTIVNGKPVYEIIRPIAAHQELVVYYLPDQERPKELFYAHMRSILNRRTMDSILEVLEGKLSHTCFTVFLLDHVMLCSKKASIRFDLHQQQQQNSSNDIIKLWEHSNFDQIIRTFGRKTGNSA